ncbi:MAG TPA: glycosyltransferase, partial [Mycobacterium sp.]|nr:glycosyltransferase [Mycobacterium sp.]
MRVAIVAESFLPNVNGVTNSVVRILEHLNRTGHDAIVIAPDNPRPQERAATAHDGVPVHRMPSRMFPKVTSLPLSVPRPRIAGILRDFDPDVVHLASPAMLGYGGLQAARFLGMPTVAVFQTDVPGFAESYGVGVATRAAWAWFRHLHRHADRTLAPSSSAIENLTAHGIPRVHLWARGVDIAGFAPSARDDALRRRWSPDGKPIVGFVGRLAPEKHVERLRALNDDVRVVVVGGGVDRPKLEKLLPAALFTGALYGPQLHAA